LAYKKTAKIHEKTEAKRGARDFKPTVSWRVEWERGRSKPVRGKPRRPWITTDYSPVKIGKLQGERQ